jgi:hypothetical protein
VDEEEDEADDQPNDREGVEDALKEGFQLSVPSSQYPVPSFVILSGASANALAESKDLAFCVLAQQRPPNTRSFDCARRLASLTVVLRSG